MAVSRKEQPLPDVEALPTAEARADVDPVLEKQLKSLQTQAAVDASKRPTGMQVPWLMPEKLEWSGDLFDWAGLGKAFTREYSNSKFEESVKDPAKPGTVGDMGVTTIQIDYLACMQRAFAARHTMRRPRALAHHCARKHYQGLNTGPLVQSVTEFVRGLVKASKDGA